MIYDTAHRIGAFLGLEPEHVYVHAGTTVGAKALGLKSIDGWVAMDDLPEVFRKLKPYEVEDFLCIYKKKLKESSNY